MTHSNVLPRIFEYFRVGKKNHVNIINRTQEYFTTTSLFTWSDPCEGHGHDMSVNAYRNTFNLRLTKGGGCNPPYGFSPVALKRQRKLPRA